MALVGRRERAYRIRMLLYRFLFAPVLLAVAVLGGAREERRPAPPAAVQAGVAPAPAAPDALRAVPAGDERAPVRRTRAAR